MTSFDQIGFRNALGTFATGITVITTTNTKKEPVGITVNSFTSVSLEPPLILWCLDKNADSYEDFVNCIRFAVHVLHEDQEAISHNFAIKSNNKFAELEWENGEFGSPILNDFSTCFQCETEERYTGGDHIIFLGRIRSIQTHPGKEPLIYHAGSYRLLKSS